MKLKVCGMKYPDNVTAVAALQPDYLGFIFYKPSKRYCGDTLTPAFVKALPSSLITTGVFVDEPLEDLLQIVKDYGFRSVQLHGHESADYCATLKKEGLQVIKVFHVDAEMDWSITLPYKKVCDFFLFDTKTHGYGGSGKRFDWSALTAYDNDIPVFLSGGIDETILTELDSLASVNLYALDINSRFETEPGRKDVERVKKFINKLKA